MLVKKWYIYHQLENIFTMKYLTVPKAIAAWTAIQPLSDRDREQLGINKSAVQRLLSSLKEKGYIEARDNEGGWRVLISPSL